MENFHLIFVGDSFDPHAEKLQLLVTLFVMFAAAKVFAEIFERLKQPAVVGEILAGVLIGPSLLGWVVPSLTTGTLAEIGVILLMFTVGLETEPRAIFSVGKTALAVAVLGVVLPFVLGFGAILAFGASLELAQTTLVAAFVGAAMVATSVGITARVLADMGLLSHQSARVILAAAVIDDILALLLLSVVAGMASPDGVNWPKIILTAVLAIGFVAFIVLAGARIVGKVAPKISQLHMRDPLFGVAMALCLGLALLSEHIGIAAIIGAFLAGMALAEFSDQEHLLHKSETLVALFLPFFLVNIGMQVSLEAFKSPLLLWLAALLTVLAVGGKYVAGLIAARGLGKRMSKQIGMGMVPRGEVGIVAAQLGLTLGVLDNRLFSAVLFMAVATTIIAPPFLRALFAGENGQAGQGLVVEENPVYLQ